MAFALFRDHLSRWPYWVGLQRYPEDLLLSHGAPNVPLMAPSGHFAGHSGKDVQGVVGLAGTHLTVS